MQTPDSPDNAAHHSGVKNIHTAETEAAASASLLSKKNDRPLASKSPSPKKQSSTIQRLLLDTWVCESVAISLSIGCMIAIVVIVKQFEGGEIPRLLFGVTLNTIVAVLATAARSTVSFVVSASIGQLKWCWFTKSGKRLRDVEVLDNASRGPLGAISMLSSALGGPFAWLGAVITILMVSFGPLLQQLLEYPMRESPIPTSEAKLFRNIGFNQWALDDDIYRESIASAVFSNEMSYNPNITCPSKQCSWDNYKSTSWCSKCENRTLEATLSDCNIRDLVGNNASHSSMCILSLGEGAGITTLDVTRQANTTSDLWSDLWDANLTSVFNLVWPVSYGPAGSGIFSETDFDVPLPNISSNWTYGSNSTFLGISNPLLVLGQANLSTENLRNNSWVDIDEGRALLEVDDAQLCVLTFCENDYDVSIDGTVLDSNVTLTEYGDIIWYPVPIGNDTVWTQCWEAQPGEGLLSCDATTWANVIMPYVVGNLTTFSSGQYMTESYDSHDMARSDIRQSLLPLNNTSGPLGNHSTYDLEQRLRNIGISLTNNQAANWVEEFSGYTVVDETYVRVRWRWIVLPVTLQVLSLALFIGTIVQSKRLGAPIWKSSILAAIYHNTAEKDNEYDLNRLSSMHNAASTTSVQFSKD